MLLDSKTQPPSIDGSLMPDDHYQFVMQFMYQERQSRLKLEKYVKQLQQKLVTTKTDLTNEIDSLKQCTCAFEIKSKASILQYNFNILKQDHDALRIHYVNLQKELITTNNKYIVLENEVSLLKQLKSVSDLKVVFNMEKKTDHLQQQIKATNRSQHAINSEAIDKKQDFLALYQKVQTSETEIQSNNQRFENQSKKMERKIQEIIEKCDVKTKQISVDLSKSQNSMQNRITALSTKLNEQILSIKQEQNEIADKALFTASPDTGTFTTNSVIPFKYTMTIYGIKNQSSIENNGIFTVENGGIYLISCFINTDTVSTKFSIMRNSDRLAAATKHGDNYYESHAATIVAGLSAGDIVKVQANTNIFVDTGPDSMLTVVQII